MPDENRRAPARPKSITDISPGDDIRVRIVGTVLDIRDDSIMLDDGTGTTEVFMNEDDLAEMDDGKRIRVFGRVLPTPDSFEIQGEIVQPMDGLDMELYRKARDVLDEQA